MILAVVGSRDFNDYTLLCTELDNLKPSTIVSGEAPGTDTYAKRYAKENNLHYIGYPADWNKFGKSAGYIRNKDIVNACQYLIAFWDGKSNGTIDSIKTAIKQNKLLKIVKYLETNIIDTLF